MSDQPGSTPELIPASPAALRDTRWLAGAIWGGLLLALIVTSWAAVTGGGIAATFSYFPFISLGNQNPEDMEPELVATVAVVLTAVVAALVVLAWIRFANATLSLVSSLSDSGDDAEDQPATMYWLPTVPGQRSELVDLVGLIGIAWGTMILRPIVVVAIQIYSSS